MYHYTECGLRNVWLRNGYEKKATKYGEAVAFQDIDGLHKAIGLHLVDRKPRLSASEIRFLRIELDLTQEDLGDILGVGVTTIRGWEKNRQRITRPAERLLRALYREHVSGDGRLRDVIDRIAQANRDTYNDKLTLEECDEGWCQAA